MENQSHREPATFETVWASLQELSAAQKDADRRLKETERVMKENARETERFIKESARETDRQMKETDRRLNKMQGNFENRWGELIESLVEGDLVHLLQSWDIPVHHTHSHSHGRRNGEQYEFDILAVNGGQVVVVEVKSTLRPEDVNHFLGKLAKFTEYAPEYKGKTIYGAVAYLKASESAPLHAERQGLFVIRATGDSASLVNAEGFMPRAFG